MNVYVWREVAHVSSSYHCGGGVVVFADTLEEARTLAHAEDSHCVIAETEAPDEVRECAAGPKRAFIMPDAGCC